MFAPIARALGPFAPLLACLAVLAPTPALALDAPSSPSAKELWQAYPLKPRQRPAGSPTAATARTATPAPRGSGSGVTTLLLVLVGVCLAGGAGVLAWRVVRARPQAPTPVVTAPRLRTLVPAMPLLSGALAGGGPRRPNVSESRERRPPPGGQPRRRAGSRASGGRVAPLPSDPRRGWTAEIEWRPGETGSRFWVMAVADDGTAKAPVAQSAVFEWSPSGPTAVQSLSDSARALEEALLAAGWTPLPAGDAWYAKRFRWEPRPAAARPGAAPRTDGAARSRPAQPGTGRPAAARPETPRPAAAKPGAARPAAARPAGADRTGRFKRDPHAWPAEARELWRCELKWDAGYFNSRFQAVVYPPGTEPGRPVAAGPAFKWTFMSDPDPKGPRHVAQVRSLVSALEAAGWERVDRGPAWFAHRFVWRRAGRPPERVELAADEAAT
ncbi:MAG TPA: hypothetical protein VH418_19985 [Solirubrobacteraceae bacterium]